MKLSGAEIVIKLLENEGVKYIAGIPGGFNLPLYNALYESKITHILARHEQGAAFIAQGISRTSNSVGVCFATSGPGATNIITAIADAKLDSIPLVAITGQVPLSAIGTDAFQEVDSFGLFMPICKHNYLIRSVEELFTVIPEAFYLAKEGRPGPIVIDIPKDIQSEIIDLDKFPTYKPNPRKYPKDYDLIEIKKAASIINNSFKPIIYAGGGLINSGASKELLEISEKNNIPMTFTLMGLASIDSSNPLNLGMIGMHGAPFTNYLINEADLIIALGVRFDDRATGDINSFCPKASIIHIDIDPSEIHKLKSTTMSLVSDLKDFLTNILPYINSNDRSDWLNYISKLKSDFPLPRYNDELHPTNLIPLISELIPKDSIIVTDVGQHQMWTAQRYPFSKTNSLITSGGLGTMGFGLPAAIGAALANPDKLILLFSGDGSILMNIQEFATIADYNLNIKIIILNNKHLGLVRQQQELFYNEHYVASKFIRNPDFCKISEGFGIKSYEISPDENISEKLSELLSTTGGVLINIPIIENEKVLPMVAPGSSNLNMVGVEKKE